MRVLNLNFEEFEEPPAKALGARQKKVKARGISSLFSFFFIGSSDKKYLIFSGLAKAGHLGFPSIVYQQSLKGVE